MAWQFVLCELDTVALAGKPIGEINNAYDRSVTLGINGLGTASFKLRLDNPRAIDITDREADCLVKVYQGTTLRLVAECVSAEEDWDEVNGWPTVACTFANPMWRLRKRLAGSGATGEGVSYTAVDRAGLLHTLHFAANAQKDTGVRTNSVAALRAINAGPWVFKPVAEIFDEMAASFAPPAFETVTTKTSEDTFTGTPSSALAARTSSSGHTWNSAGSSLDWTIDTTGVYAYRNGSFADSGYGRHGILSSAHPTPAVLVQSSIFRDATMGLPAADMGVMCRYIDSSNYLRFTVTTEVAGSQIFRLTKIIGGVGTHIWQSNPGTILDPTPFGGGMRIVVDATGRYALWWWPLSDTSYQATPIMVGYDADLATGETLDGDTHPGACGIFNFVGGTGTGILGWDDYFTATPATSLDAEALEFELAPTEPTADTNSKGVVGAGIQIAELNVAARIGTDRPNVIFEQGDGNRTMKSYKRAISKDALMTRGYVLPSDVATPWPAGTLVTREDTAAVLARGLFEDVVSTDAGAARAAVLDLHLNFRKQARQVITFDPSATARYTYGTDYEVGDTVTARAKFQGAERFNGLFRIYKVDISIDDEGKESVSPTLTLD